MSETATCPIILIRRLGNGRWKVLYVSRLGMEHFHDRYESEDEAVNMARALAHIHDCEWTIR